MYITCAKSAKLANSFTSLSWKLEQIQNKSHNNQTKVIKSKHMKPECIQLLNTSNWLLGDWADLTAGVASTLTLRKLESSISSSSDSRVTLAGTGTSELPAT